MKYSKPFSSPDLVEMAARDGRGQGLVQDVPCFPGKVLTVELVIRWLLTDMGVYTWVAES